MGVSNEARIQGVIGASGQGKGVLIKAMLKKERPHRLIILDTKDENGAFAERVPRLADLARASFAKKFQVRYVPTGMTPQARQTEFETLCRIVSAAKDCTFVVEELGRYTRPSYAPPAWADCCNDGRHDGLHIIAASQFPAQIDKAFLGNATEVFCFHLGVSRHRKVMAEELDIMPDEIKALPQFHYLHFNRAARTVTPGVVKIPR